MRETKLGISTGLLAALLFLSGLVNSLTLTLLAGYVLLIEKDEWLRRAAIKAVVLFVVFRLTNGVLDVLDYAFGFVNNILSNFRDVSFRLSFPANLESILASALNFLEKGLFLLLGVQALAKRTVSLGFIERMTERHSAKSARGEQGERLCPACGAQLQKASKFCTNCGQRLEAGNRD